MKKRILAMIMAIALVLCPMSIFAEVGSGEITVYLSLSRYGEILTSKDGEVMAYVPVTLSGKESYNLDDCLREAHIIYCPDGESAYASSASGWGLGIEKLWGDESDKFGYQLNRGEVQVTSLENTIQNGDFVDAFIYESYYPDTEGYSYFDKQNAEISIGEEISLALTFMSGYDEEFNSVYSLCEEANITLNGEETEISTDENGQATLFFDEAGTYVVSARKDKLLGETSVAAITAPVCVVTVKEDEREQILHGIAKMYSESNLSEAGGNLPWILADMAAYEEVFGENENSMSEEKKKEALDLMVSFAESAEKPGDIAKSILGLRALGCDVREIFTKNYKHVDLVERLMALVESEDSAVTNIYTLPYVIIALGQTEPTVAEGLVLKAIEKKEEWQSVQDGTDAITPMISALAPYAENNGELLGLIEESIEIVRGEMREDGLIDGFEGYESASTGLAIWALSSAGVDASSVVLGEISIIDGLLSVKNEQNNGFPNAFATEQGFRGLLAWRLMTDKNDKEIYNFSDYSEEEINFTGAEFCPVKINVSPVSAQISSESGEVISGNVYDFPTGEHTITLSAPFYKTASETFIVSEEEADNHILKTISISLRSESSGGGGGYIPKPKPEEEPEEEPEELLMFQRCFLMSKAMRGIKRQCSMCMKMNCLQGQTRVLSLKAI